MLDCNILDSKDKVLHDFIMSVLKESYEDVYFIELSKILKKIGLLNAENYETLSENIYEYYESTLTDIVIDSDIFSGFYSLDDLTFSSKNNIKDLLEDELLGLECPDDTDVYYLVSDLIDLCNLEAIVEHNIDQNDYTPSYSGGRVNGYGQGDFTSEIASYFREKN
ncbi:hypothetical protein AKH03_22620 [Vibrio parahaemolyticus]|nr:hypothetical protein AKH03_22620 [Vibrio parahaemolyticus]